MSPELKDRIRRETYINELIIKEETKRANLGKMKNA